MRFHKKKPFQYRLHKASWTSVLPPPFYIIPRLGEAEGKCQERKM